MNLLEYFLWGAAEEFIQRKFWQLPSAQAYSAAIRVSRQLSRLSNTTGPHGFPRTP